MSLSVGAWLCSTDDDGIDCVYLGIPQNEKKTNKKQKSVCEALYEIFMPSRPSFRGFRNEYSSAFLFFDWIIEKRAESRSLFSNIRSFRLSFHVQKPSPSHLSQTNMCNQLHDLLRLDWIAFRSILFIFKSGTHFSCPSSPFFTAKSSGDTSGAKKPINFIGNDLNQIYFLRSASTRSHFLIKMDSTHLAPLHSSITAAKSGDIIRNSFSRTPRAIHKLLEKN